MKIDNCNKDSASYNLICDELGKDGWAKETTFINEKMEYTISLNSANPGETKLIVDIKCPDDQKILIRGTKNGDIKNFKGAYPARLTIKDSSGKEISQFTRIRIVHRTANGDMSNPARVFYADISKNDDDHLYRFRENVFLQDNDHLLIYVIGDNPIDGPRFPDIMIDKNNISFSIKADIFTKCQGCEDETQLPL